MLLKKLDYTVKIDMSISQEDLETLYEMAKIVIEEFDQDSKEEVIQYEKVFKDLKQLRESVQYFETDSKIILGRY